MMHYHGGQAKAHAGTADPGNGGGHGGGSHGNMATVFEWNSRVRLLFDGLESRTGAQFATVLVFLFAAGVVREMLAAGRRHTILGNGGGERGAAAAEQMRKQAALQYMGLYAYDMCLMLLIMSFNVGVFGAIVFGVGVGHYIFFDTSRLPAARHAELDTEKLPCC